MLLVEHYRDPSGTLKRLRDSDGGSMIEFAMAGMLLLFLLMGILECARAMYTQHFVISSARDAARYAMTRGSYWSGTACSSVAAVDCMASGANVTAYVKSLVPPGIDSTSLTISTSWPAISATGASCDVTNGANSSGCVVRVDISYPFTLLLPVPQRTFNFRSFSEITIAR